MSAINEHEYYRDAQSQVVSAKERHSALQSEVEKTRAQISELQNEQMGYAVERQLFATSTPTPNNRQSELEPTAFVNFRNGQQFETKANDGFDDELAEDYREEEIDE